MELHELISVSETIQGGVYSVSVDITDSGGDRYICDYVSSPDDPFGLAPTVRIAVEQWVVDGKPVAPYIPPPPPTAEEIRVAMPDLERWRVNTVIDLTPGLRDKINAAIEAMPEPQRTISRNKLADVQLFKRTDPLFDMIGGEPSIGLSPEQIDAMWAAALEL